MELREIKSMSELSELVSASTFDAFYQKIVQEDQKYGEEHYEEYKNEVFRQIGVFRRMLYSNWTASRGIIRIFHLLRGHKYPKEYYQQEKPLSWEYKRYRSKFKYPFITDESSDARPFFDVAKDIYDNIEQYRSTYELLEDEASKKVLMGTLVSRLTGNYRYLEDLASANPQYFDSDIIKTYSNEVLVDAGGYTGDTAEALLETAAAKGKVKKIHLYEPSRDNIEQAKKNLSKFNVEVVFHQSGVSDKRGSFSVADSGAGSPIVADMRGMHSVDIVTLDEDIEEKTTFIKMDIEGSEKAALLGCRRHILEDIPKLAICVYHKLNDVWWVPQYIKNLNPNYKFYLRYYYQGPMGDIVIYCLPCQEETADAE